MGSGPSFSTTLLELLLLDEAQEGALRVVLGAVMEEVDECFRSLKLRLALPLACRGKGFPESTWDSSIVTEGTCSVSVVTDRGTEYADEAAEDFDPVEFEWCRPSILCRRYSPSLV